MAPAAARATTRPALRPLNRPGELPTARLRALAARLTAETALAATSVDIAPHRDPGGAFAYCTH